MIEFYPQIKFVHMLTVALSGLLFTLRGLLAIAGRERMALSLPMRVTSWTIDTTLLSAALMLLTILPHGMFANGWLWAKMALLLVYIGFGAMALQRQQPPNRRLAFFVAALLVFGLMVSVARYHHPLGIVYALFMA